MTVTTLHFPLKSHLRTCGRCSGLFAGCEPARLNALYKLTLWTRYANSYENPVSSSTGMLERIQAARERVCTLTKGTSTGENIPYHQIVQHTADGVTEHFLEPQAFLAHLQSLDGSRTRT